MKKNYRTGTKFVLFFIQGGKNDFQSITGSVLAFLFLFFLCSCAARISENDIQKSNAHLQLGISYVNDNNIQPAFVEFQKAIELNPNDKEAHNAIGVVYLKKLGDNENAVKHFKAAIKIDSNYSEAANNLGSAYANMGN
jgi:type IV pilus assembly protein PilF